jgi:Tol biopolymer transport system component
MKHIISLPAAGARIATSVAIGLAATFLFACASDSTPTSPSPAASAATVSRIPVVKQDRIVFMSDRETYGTTYNFDIYSMLPDGSGVTRLTSMYDHANPALSPDGKHIVFASNRDNPLYDIYVMKSDGSSVTRLTTTAAANLKPTWSADGSKIVFTSTRNAADPSARGVGASWEIYIMNADGSNQTRITNNNLGEWDPQMSPDGAHIVFTSERDHLDSPSIRELYIMNVDGSNVHRLTVQDGQIEAPSFDASGTRIVYDVAAPGSAPGIYVLSGHTPTRLTFSVGSLDFSPTWSPDGKQIAYTHFISGVGSQIFKMNADGSSPKQLTRDPHYAARPDWGR